MTPVSLLSAPVAQLTSAGIEISGAVRTEHTSILTPDALHFIADMHRKFNGLRLKLLAERRGRQLRLDGGQMPDFLPTTEDIRHSRWRVAPIPRDLQDRRVEITGPVDRKMIINALNSGANCFMADFEDSHSPTWIGTLDGQANVQRPQSPAHRTTALDAGLLQEGIELVAAGVRLSIQDGDFFAQLLTVTEQ